MGTQIANEHFLPFFSSSFSYLNNMAADSQAFRVDDGSESCAQSVLRPRLFLSHETLGRFPFFFAYFVK
jgi:hypothetical protein